MTLSEEILLAAIGCAAGFVNVLAGGGSLLTLPAMVLLGLPGPAANGTNRIAILFQNIAAVTAFFRQGYSDFRLSLTLALCAVPGAVAGAAVGTRLEGVWFNRFLAAVMIAVIFLMRKRRPPAPERSGGPPAGAGRMAAAHLLMVGAGFYGGFIQAGVGFLMMAILHRVAGIDLVRVNMHKVFIAGTYTVPALAVYAAHGDVLVRTGLFLAAGNALGGWIGSHAAVRRGETFIRLVLVVALVAMAVRLLTLAG